MGRRRRPARYAGHGRRGGATRRTAIGVDIVSADHISGLLARHPRAAEVIFTDAEIEYSRRAANAGERFAARFAAKEAVLKALGTGMARGMTWTDIEVGTTPSGRPVLSLHGAVARRAALMGLDVWQLSLSHGRGTAVAYVVASGSERAERRNGIRVGRGNGIRAERRNGIPDNDGKGVPLRRQLEAA